MTTLVSTSDSCSTVLPEATASKDYALIGYPLSRGFRDRFEESVGAAPHYLGIPELRRMGIPRMLKLLRRLDADRILIPLESDSSQVYLPVFYCLAGIAQARRIELVYPDLHVEAISRARTCRSLAAVVAATISGQAALQSCRRELQRLLHIQRIPWRATRSSRVVYLKTNLWAGVQAGGSVGHVAGVTNALAAAGHEIDFLGIEPPLMVDSSVRFHAVPTPRAFAVPYELNLYRFQREFVRHARPYIDSAPCAFLYQRMSVGNYAGVVLSRATQTPLILEYNGSEVWASTHWGRPSRYRAIAQMAEDVCLKHAHLIVTVSRVLGDELISRGVEPERIVVYPNCIDPQVFQPERFSSAELAQLRQRWNIRTDAMVIGFVGTFGPWHGVEVLAETIRRMAGNDADWLRRQRVHFLIVGDGLKMGDVRTLLADANCRPFVTLTGLVPQQEAALYMAAADIVVSPHVPNQDGSQFFGSPTKLFEYMAMGKPIIASDLEQIGEILRTALHAQSLTAMSSADEESARALLCQPGNVDDLALAIRYLVSRPDWRTVLGANARREALTKYTWDRHVAAILDRLTDRLAG